MDRSSQHHPRPRHRVARRLRVFTTAFALLALASACSSDSTSPSERPAPPTSVGGNRVAQVLQCRVDVAAANLSCASVAPSTSVTPAAQLGHDARFTVMVGNQDRYVRLASSNVIASSGVFSADVTVQNLLLQPLGTLDGFSPDAAGVRVFFNTGPTSGVTVANADGTGTFTAANQPYFQYSEVLKTSDVSSAKSWQFALNGATSFTFEVYVTAEVPNDASLSVSLASITAGYQHACGLDPAGRGYCWGFDGYGQLGSGRTVINRTTPFPVSGGLTFASLVAGQNTTCGLTTPGVAYCWGYDGEGQVGDGTMATVRSTPTLVAGGLTFTTLSVAQHTCGITTTGAAYCWGLNPNGQGGDGTTTYLHLTPTAVVGGLKFIAIAADDGIDPPFSGGHTCALSEAHAAYCWGSNSSGELGDGTTTSRIVPTLVTGGLTFTSITVGPEHSCALTAAGAAYCWGLNGDGRLGDGTTTLRSTPTAVAGGLTFASIQTSSASLHTCAITTAGAAYCWGANPSGQLGDSTTTSQSTPTAVAGGIAFAAIAPGGNATCGVALGGIGYCWGINTWGQLGDGTQTPRLTPGFVASTRTRATP